jgi:hypothetical protein
MSKYWDPAWAKPTLMQTFLNPDEATLDSLIDALRPSGSVDDPTPQLCWKGNRSIMATFGPDAVLLVPAAHRVAAAELQREVGRLTFYFICTRPRIRATDCNVSGSSLLFHFNVFHDDGTIEQVEKSIEAPDNVRSAEVVDHGTAINYELVNGVAKHEAALTAQALFRTTPFQASFLDLDVRYIGRARGQIAEQCALDRLESHEKYQAVMEEILASPSRNRDVWLVLGAGTNMDFVGSLDPDAEKPRDSEVALEVHKIRSTLFTPRRIDITEALLINYFKPPLNEQWVGELELKSKTFKHCYEAGLSGLQLVFPTHELGVALYTEHVKRALWNVMTVCLYDDQPPRKA